MFYTGRHAVEVEYREEPCRSALNRVRGMPFDWSLNPYTGCAHRCTFCYVRAFEARADRPSDDRYGRSIRVKTTSPRCSRASFAGRRGRARRWPSAPPPTPTSPPRAATGSRAACLEVLAAASNPLSLITRGPMIVRDLDVLVEASSRAEVSVVFSVPTLDEEVWRRTEPGTAPPRQRLRALSRLVDAGDEGERRHGADPARHLRPARPARGVVRAAREAGAVSLWANVLYLRPGTREHFLEQLARDWPEQLGRYEELYRGRAYLPAAETAELRATGRTSCGASHGIGDRRRLRPDARRRSGRSSLPWPSETRRRPGPA